MRPEMRSTLIYISTSHERNSLYITFHCRRNEVKFRFGSGLRNTVHWVKGNYSRFDEIHVCADGFFSYDFISVSVYMRFYHLKRNLISVNMTTLK